MAESKHISVTGRLGMNNSISWKAARKLMESWRFALVKHKRRKELDICMELAVIAGELE